MNYFYDSEEDESAQFSEDKTLIVINNKLNALSKLLTLDPFKEDGTLDTPLKPISEEKIEPVLLICPMAMQCETSTCNPQSLLQHSCYQDVSKVTLIKGTKIYNNVSVLCGQCPKCQTKYYAHESSMMSQNTQSRYYLNSAKYLKIGSQLWLIVHSLVQS